METLQIIILGIIQGITEFLPISSSGHLILVPQLTDWPDQGLLFDISVHVGTLAAVMFYFRKETFQLVRGSFDILRLRLKSEDAQLTFLLAISTIPLVLVAPLIKDFVELNLRTMLVIAATSIVFGLLLWVADARVKHCSEQKKMDKMTSKEALIFGLFQVMAMVPGTSRSGICMTAGRFLGFSREDASRYAMLMSIPVIMMIGGYSLVSDFHVGLNLQENMEELLFGGSISFVCALLAIHALMKFVERIGFLPFVMYRLGLGVFLLYLTIA